VTGSSDFSSNRYVDIAERSEIPDHGVLANLFQRTWSDRPTFGCDSASLADRFISRRVLRLSGFLALAKMSS